MKLSSLLAGLLFLAVATSQSVAGTILYYNDYSINTDRMGQALTALAGTHTTTVATSPGDFATKLSSGGFQLGIFFQQNSSGNSDYDSAFAALATHIDNGGLAIAADWTGNTTNAAPFGVSFPADNNNQTQFTISDPNLLTGLSNPVLLLNPGWGTFSYDMNPLGLSSSGAAFPVGGSAIVTGNNGRTIYNGFLSDTFSNGAAGTQLYINEINSLFATQVVPEPSSLCIFAIVAGAGGVFGWRRKRLAATNSHL